MIVHAVLLAYSTLINDECFAYAMIVLNRPFSMSQSPHGSQMARLYMPSLTNRLYPYNINTLHKTLHFTAEDSNVINANGRQIDVRTRARSDRIGDPGQDNVNRQAISIPNYHPFEQDLLNIIGNSKDENVKSIYSRYAHFLLIGWIHNGNLELVDRYLQYELTEQVFGMHALLNPLVQEAVSSLPSTTAIKTTTAAIRTRKDGDKMRKLFVNYALQLVISIVKEGKSEWLDPYLEIEIMGSVPGYTPTFNLEVRKAVLKSGHQMTKDIYMQYAHFYLTFELSNGHLRRASAVLEWEERLPLSLAGMQPLVSPTVQMAVNHYQARFPSFHQRFIEYAYRMVLLAIKSNDIDAFTRFIRVSDVSGYKPLQNLNIQLAIERSESRKFQEVFERYK